MFQRTPPRFDHRVRELQLRERQQTAETPVIKASTWAFTFSAPASANTTGEVSEHLAPWVASSSTATLLTGANVSATRHATRVERSCRSPHGHRRGFRPGGESPSCRCATSRLAPSCAAPLSAWPDVPGAEGAASRTPVRGGTRSRATPRPCRAAARERERAGRDVTVLGRGDDVPDRLDFGGGQSMRRRPRTCRLIVEGTRVSRRREA